MSVDSKNQIKSITRTVVKSFVVFVGEQNFNKVIDAIDEGYTLQEIKDSIIDGGGAPLDISTAISIIAVIASLVQVGLAFVEENRSRKNDVENDKLRQKLEETLEKISSSGSYKNPDSNHILKEKLQAIVDELDKV